MRVESMLEAYISPTIDPILTIVPERRFTIMGTTAWHKRSTANVLVSNICLTSSIGISTIGPEMKMLSDIEHGILRSIDIPGAITPALLTRTSSFPSVSVICSIIFATLSSLFTSRANFSILLPSAKSAMVSTRREVA